VQVGSVIFAAFTVVTNTQTAHFTPSVVGIACIYAGFGLKYENEYYVSAAL